jgi:hypothetical protein
MSIFRDFFMTIFYHFVKNIFENRIFCHNFPMFGGGGVHQKSPQLPTTSKGG